MSKKLNLNHTHTQKFDLLVNLYAYKFLGDKLAGNLNLNSLGELVKSLSLLDSNEKLKNPTLEKFYNVINKDITHD